MRDSNKSRPSLIEFELVARAASEYSIRQWEGAWKQAGFSRWKIIKNENERLTTDSKFDLSVHLHEVNRYQS